jgi:hypothetical protein
MATTIAGDVSTVVPIEYQDTSGQAVATPVGDAVTVQCDSAAVSATVEQDGTGNRSLVLTPVQPALGGAMANVTITDTLADGSVIVTAPEVFEIASSASVNPASVHLRLDMITTRPLPGRSGARVTISR